MQVKMLRQQDLSLNDGLTTQTLQAGQIYDLPEALALDWVRGGFCALTGPPPPDETGPPPPAASDLSEAAEG